MDLIGDYQRHCLHNRFAEDAHQIQLITEMQSFAEDLSSGRGDTSGRGLYLWGPVGRGKTMLMDLFFDSLEVAGKRRVHFHELMRWVRDRLAELSGQANPMTVVAAELVPAGSVICIDEFHVSDVDNALVVELLLKELISSRTVVVTTSNFSPENVIDDALGNEFRKNNPDAPLEGGGLFRTSKRETLRLLGEAFHVARIGGSRDYRTSVGADVSTFLDLQLQDAASVLQRQFDDISRGAELISETSVFGRPVSCRQRTADVFWFDYQQICEASYSYRDYLELLAGARAVLLEDVDIRTLDGAKRFGWLIEVVYDAGIQLIMTGRGGLDGLYGNIEVPPHLALEHERVASRVRELTRGNHASDA